MTYLLLLQIYEEVFCKTWKFHVKKSPPKLLNKKIPRKRKIPKTLINTLKRFVFSKFAGFKNEFIHTYFSSFFLKV